MALAATRILKAVLKDQIIRKAQLNSIVTSILFSSDLSEPEITQIRQMCFNGIKSHRWKIDTKIISRACKNISGLRMSVLMLISTWEIIPSRLFSELFKEEFRASRQSKYKLILLADILTSYLSKNPSLANRYRNLIEFIIRHRDYNVKKMAIEPAALLKYPTNEVILIFLQGLSHKDASFRLSCANAFAHLFAGNERLPRRICVFLEKSKFEKKLINAADNFENINGWRLTLSKLLAAHRTI